MNDLIKKLKKRGCSTSFDWFNSLFLSGRLAILTSRNSSEIDRANTNYVYYFCRDSKKDTNTFYEDFRLKIKSIVDMFGDKWDIEFDIIKLGKRRVVLIKNIVIHFPELTITNTKRNSHNIKDLFMVLPLYINDSRNFIRIFDLYGFRTTFTYEEIMSRYSHSHLSGNPYDCKQLLNEPNIFPIKAHYCTGSGIINMTLGDVNAAEKFNEDTFSMLLVQMTTMVSWESLEGTPYQYINEISLKVSNNNPDSRITYLPDTLNNNGVANVIRRLLRDESTNLNFKDFPFILKNGRFELKEDKFREAIIKACNYSGDLKNNIFGIKDEESGRYISFSSIKEALSVVKFREPEEQQNYLFRDREIELKIIYPETNSDKLEKYEELAKANLQLNERSFKKLKEDIENDVNKKYIREAIIGYKDKSKSAS